MSYLERNCIVITAPFDHKCKCSNDIVGISIRVFWVPHSNSLLPFKSFALQCERCVLGKGSLEESEKGKRSPFGYFSFKSTPQNLCILTHGCGDTNFKEMWGSIFNVVRKRFASLGQGSYSPSHMSLVLEFEPRPPGPQARSFCSVSCHPSGVASMPGLSS